MAITVALIAPPRRSSCSTARSDPSGPAVSLSRAGRASMERSPPSRRTARRTRPATGLRATAARGCRAWPHPNPPRRCDPERARAPCAAPPEWKPQAAPDSDASPTTAGFELGCPTARPLRAGETPGEDGCDGSSSVRSGRGWSPVSTSAIRARASSSIHCRRADAGRRSSRSMRTRNLVIRRSKATAHAARVASRPEPFALGSAASSRAERSSCAQT